MKNNEFDVSAVNDGELVAWPRVAAVSAMVAFSLPTFITGLEVSQGLSVWHAFLALFWGSVIVFVIGAATGVIGARSRMSSYLLVRIAFGDIGAGIVNIAFAVSLLGWFGLNINLFVDAITRLSNDLWGIAIPSLWLSVLASVCMTVTTIVGFKAINIGAVLMVPVLAFITLLFAFNAFTSPEFSNALAIKSASDASIGDGVSAVVGAIIIGAIILPDITRFVRHWHGAVYTAFIGYIVIQLTVLMAASLAGKVAANADVLDIMLSLNLGLGAFLIVIAGSWILNSLNLYSAVLGVKATFPQFDSLVISLSLGLFGVAAALLNILDRFIDFLFYLSVIFVPVAGVLMVDALTLRPDDYRIETLSQNKRVNLSGFIAWLIGAVVAVLASEGLIPALTHIAALDAIALSAMSYWLLHKLLSAKRSAS